MAKKGASTTNILEAHSRAKVELLGKYLGIYLNIMQRAQFITRLHFFDLCAGEGVYADGGKGSPIKIMQAVKDNYFSNGQKCPDMTVLFNDPGISAVEPGVKKIDRVRTAVEKLYIPNNVKVSFSDKDYRVVLQDALAVVNAMRSNERAVIFIDPHGYKDIKPNDLVELMKNGRTEVILFLPTSFMYRFAQKALSEEEFPGGAHLREFLSALFDGEPPDCSHALAFIDSLLEQFRRSLGINYVDRFTIERENGNYFCLYFFTNHVLGLKKMVEAKWDMDTEAGRGFTLPDPQVDMFSGYEHSNYPETLEAVLKARGSMTNEEVELFGLERGHLPTHSTQVFKKWKADGRIEVVALDGGPDRSFYIGDNKRQVSIKLKGNG